MSETALGRLFKPHGKIKRVNLITDYYTRQSKCFGYVEMDDQEGGHSAIELLHGAVINDKPLVVKAARPKEQRRGQPW